nr:hypothetical protein CFP56_75077 [Quercus suber]
MSPIFLKIPESSPLISQADIKNWISKSNLSKAQPARALASKLSGEVPDCLFDDGASTLVALAASVGL